MLLVSLFSTKCSPNSVQYRSNNAVNSLTQFRIQLNEPNRENVKKMQIDFFPSLLVYLKQWQKRLYFNRQGLLDVDISFNYAV